VQKEIKKILVVDDEPEITDLIKLMLSPIGYEVIKAGNGKKGLDVFNSENPDLVITDIVMPDMEGIELVRSLLKINQELPIIVMSGNPTGTKFLKIAGILGAHSSINKPFSAEELVILIKNIENSR